MPEDERSFLLRIEMKVWHFVFLGVVSYQNPITMNYINALKNPILSRFSFSKLVLFVLLLSAGRVKGQNVNFGDNLTEMLTTDGVNFILTDYEANYLGTGLFFYISATDQYFVGLDLPSGIAVPYNDSLSDFAYVEPITYSLINFNINTKEYSFITDACDASLVQLSISSNFSNLLNSNLGSAETLSLSFNPVNQLYASGWNFQWKKDGLDIAGATSSSYSVAPDQQGVYTFQATCAASGQTLTSNAINKIAVLSDINYMLIQNVTVTGINASQGTAQVQFDINWGNSWKDSINWDAAWVFMKYKNAAGEWKHAKINATGYDHGQGTNNIIQPTTDKMGAFVRLADYGQTNFSVDGMQLQWNYGMDGLSNVSNVEVKLLATEMVYMPQGDFNVIANTVELEQRIKAPGNNAAVINNRMTPILTAGNSAQFRVKGDAGLDSNADGVIDSPNYPTGYTPFYAFKYEMTDQQYADFLNCLTIAQQDTLGVAGSSISLNNGIYYASAPNRVCQGYSNERFLAFADWAGLRPMSVLEFSKAVLGPFPNQMQWSNRYGDFYDVGRPGFNTGTGYYGMKDAYAYSAGEPIVTIASNQFSKLIHGDGAIDPIGWHNQIGWDTIEIIYGNGPSNGQGWRDLGFRFARTAE